jgi:hypothetical protein
MRRSGEKVDVEGGVGDCRMTGAGMLTRVCAGGEIGKGH